MKLYYVSFQYILRNAILSNKKIIIHSQSASMSNLHHINKYYDNNTIGLTLFNNQLAY